MHLAAYLYKYTDSLALALPRCVIPAAASNSVGLLTIEQLA